MIKTINSLNITDEMVRIYYQTGFSPRLLMQKIIEAAPECETTPDESYLRGYADAHKSKSIVHVQWEYIERFDQSANDLNALGLQGWELISVAYVPRKGIIVTAYVFKRRLSPVAEVPSCST